MEDIKLANMLNPRFGLNWVKLRAWEQSDLDAIIMVVGEGGRVGGMDTAGKQCDCGDSNTSLVGEGVGEWGSGWQAHS